MTLKEFRLRNFKYVNLIRNLQMSATKDNADNWSDSSGAVYLEFWKYG